MKTQTVEQHSVFFQCFEIWISRCRIPQPAIKVVTVGERPSRRTARPPTRHTWTEWLLRNSWDHPHIQGLLCKKEARSFLISEMVYCALYLEQCGYRYGACWGHKYLLHTTLSTIVAEQACVLNNVVLTNSRLWRELQYISLLTWGSNWPAQGVWLLGRTLLPILCDSFKHAI